MHAMHEIDEQLADRLRYVARSDLALTRGPQTVAPRRAADTFSVRLLVAREHGQDVAVLSVHGDIDLGTAPALREPLVPVLEHRTGPVVVDLSDVAFMDSTGVHVLVDTLQRLEAQNRRLAIACREGGQIHRVLGLVGLLDVLTVHRSRESAVIDGDDRLREGPAPATPRPGRLRARRRTEPSDRPFGPRRS